MSEETRISFDTYLRALGLFTMAAQHYSEMRKFELALAKMLSLDDGSHISDAIYNNVLAGRSDFDEALSLQNILVQAPEPAEVA